MSSFLDAKRQFDEGPARLGLLPVSTVPVHGQLKNDIPLIGANGERLEEYYKWQFVAAMTESGLYPKDRVGVEVHFPKGSVSSAALKLDGAVFDDAEWLTHYLDYWRVRRTEDLEWLNEHLLAVMEFKRNEHDVERVFTRQVKPAMKEKDPASAYVLGIFYDVERLYLFHRRDGYHLRYDEAKNQKGAASKVGDLSLHLPDPYTYLPSFDELRDRVHKPSGIDRTSRGVDDLEVITSINTVQIQDALSDVLRTLDQGGLVNQRGYQLLIEIFALKIYDEKRNEADPGKQLEFYVTDEEVAFSKLGDHAAQALVKRMKGIWEAAEPTHQKILGMAATDWRNVNHVRALVAVARAFQDFSFVRSSATDLYQLVFYNFANQFKRDESAQFLTPIPVIDFLVRVVNPRRADVVIDPCCGIGDFLSLAFLRSRLGGESQALDDSKIYGVDIDENMIMLATLNMLLNGDGEAKLFHKPDLGSILSKVEQSPEARLVDLQPEFHRGRNWDAWPDKTKLRKFDVVLTNPPFGEDRSFRPKTSFERDVIDCYETWRFSGGKMIDLGVVFLENAIQILKPDGRFGIVVSNSIASVNRWEAVRRWLLDRVRIVALFDLPPGVFAETDVNTTLIVGYKPPPKALQSLVASDYEVFVREIRAVGYEKRTSKRNVFFNPKYEIDAVTLEVATDAEGHPVLDEDFSSTLAEFHEWALTQEPRLHQLFVA